MPASPELPVDLLLEIAARTDAATIFRCAATCKLLRREILSADFIRRVCQGPDAVVPSRILGVLAETFSLLHPVTAATVTLEENYLAPFMSRSGSIAAAGLLEEYGPLTSRNGLVTLLRRRHRLGSERRSDDLCVYDPMTNSRAFLPFAPDIEWDPIRRLPGLGGGVAMIDHCAMLTAADGIGCSFMLVAADMARPRRRTFLDCSAAVKVQTVSSSDLDAGAGWGQVKTSDDHSCAWWCMSLDSYSDAAVVVGGVVHWLLHGDTRPLIPEGPVGILTYDVNAAAVGSVDIPKDLLYPKLLIEPSSPSQLASSSDGKLSFVAAHAHHLAVVSVWVLSTEGSWARHVQIDMMAEWGSMLQPWMDPRVELESFLIGDQRSGAVFLQFGVRFVLDMETGATCPTCLGGEAGIPYEVDLASRLASMKSY